MLRLGRCQSSKLAAAILSASQLTTSHINRNPDHNRTKTDAFFRKTHAVHEVSLGTGVLPEQPSLQLPKAD